MGKPRPRGRASRPRGSSVRTYAVKADRFFLPGGTSDAGYLVVEDGRFGFFSPEAPSCEVLDRSGRWVAPGLVDTHIHGFADHDALCPDPEGVGVASRALARHGVTSWLPTIVTASVGDTGDACAAIRAADDSGGAHIQGIFLEGPFFTEEHSGAQNPRYFLDPSVEVLDGWQERAGGMIRKVALAPERRGSDAFAAAATQGGVKVAMGHSSATFDQAMACVNAGASVFVHTYNAMSGLHHREPGMVGAAMVSRGTYAEVIVDGLHVRPEAVRALVQAKGVEHVALITDCLSCGGMPEGEYRLGDFPVVVREGAAHLRDGGNLAGSILTLDQGVRNVVDWGVATVEDAIRMATEVPARANGIDGSCGSILPGRAADFVVLDPDLAVAETYVSGASVYRRDD